MEEERVPKYLDEPPTADGVSPPVRTAAQELPFADLTWENFERLCLRLVRTRASIERARLFGVRGQDQSGIDIYGKEADGYSVYQCRRVDTLGSADLARAVDDFLDGQWADRARQFVLCTSRSAVRTELATEIERQGARLASQDPPIAFAVWDVEALSAELKAWPNLVSDFFGSAWLEAFAPGAAAEGVDQLAEIKATLERLERKSVRVVILDWAPSALREALQDLATNDEATFVRLSEEIGTPPIPDRVVAATQAPPLWLRESDGEVWSILAMAAENAGEWKAAGLAWIAVADRSDGDDRAGYLVGAAVAADLAGDSARSEELLLAAQTIAPNHPRVRLQRVDQGQGGRERLAALEGIDSEEPNVAALIAVHLATANMLVPDMEKAWRYVREAESLMPESIAVRATGVNAVIQQGRIDTNEHRSLAYGALEKAYSDAIEIRERLLELRRYEEALRMLMLATDAASLLHEYDRAKGLLRKATPEELAAPDAPEVLGDAALKAQSWREAKWLTDEVMQTEGVLRIRATAALHEGELYDQNRAIATLDELVAGGGPEAPQAALARLQAAIVPRKSEWSPEAETTLIAAGFDHAALSLKALFLTTRRQDYAAAREVLSGSGERPWAQLARLRIAVMEGDDAEISRLASAILDRGAAQEDRIECAVALVMAGELARARDVLSLTARDPSTPPAMRADAYSYLVPLLAEKLNDWDAAATFHDEWVELRPSDHRASAWTPRIANRRYGPRG